MRIPNPKGFVLVLIVLTGLLNLEVFAQESTSSASVSRSRAMAKSANPNSYRRSEVFVAPDEVAVEEFINYHKHRLPLPKADESVALDTRWGNNNISNTQREAILQIGWTTKFANDRTDLRPLNLSLVIDKSGSMSASDKMSRVKKSLLTMIGQLRSDDYVSLVVFDSQARVLCPSMRVGNGHRLRNAINSIVAGGSTNLHGGLMLGYQEARKYFENDATNRVILLTDGIANVGETDPKKIASESSEYNGQGIDLSTIGVGIDLDRELLRTLSKQGRGLFHFVADAHDINKVFVKEVQSLISPVARRVQLEVEFDSSLIVKRIYGYEPIVSHNRINIPIDDMNSGLTQLALIKFRFRNLSRKQNIPVTVKLSFFDIQNRKNIIKQQKAILQIDQNASTNTLADAMVKKNFTIAQLAQSLKNMSDTAKQKDYISAERFINNSVSLAYQRYPNMEDKDIKFILDIVEDYQRNLRRYNGKYRDDDCRQCK